MHWATPFLPPLASVLLVSGLAFRDNRATGHEEANEAETVETVAAKRPIHGKLAPAEPSHVPGEGIANIVTVTPRSWSETGDAITTQEVAAQHADLGGTTASR